MEFKCFELDFSTAVHFGNRKLDDMEHVLYADTVFSAMCHSALNIGGDEALSKLVALVSDDKMRISDLFPYGTVKNQRRYYIPRPMMELDIDNKGDSSAKKKLKKLEYIPFDMLHKYIAGDMDIETESEILKHNMGKSEIRTMASVMVGEDTKPYSVGTYTFCPGWGLYLIIGCENEEDFIFIEDILIDIGYSGIGGKRSSGLGKFELNFAKPSAYESILTSLVTEPGKKDTYMTLSLSIPQRGFIEEVISEARYALVRRGGFISSSKYTTGQVKKKESYLFRSGSTFNKTFDGELLDVSGKGNHPVWRYAKPLFLEVK